MCIFPNPVAYYGQQNIMLAHFYTQELSNIFLIIFIIQFSSTFHHKCKSNHRISQCKTIIVKCVQTLIHIQSSQCISTILYPLSAYRMAHFRLIHICLLIYMSLRGALNASSGGHAPALSYKHTYQIVWTPPCLACMYVCVCMWIRPFGSFYEISKHVANNVLSVWLSAHLARRQNDGFQ